MTYTGRSHRLLILTLAIATLTLFAAPAAAQLANNKWPMFHGNLQHTGRTTIAGPGTNTVKWTYSGIDKIKASPAVGPDGTVYVAIGYSLCAIDPSDGTDKWPEGCFSLTGDATMSAPAIDDDGNIYYGARDNRLYSIAPDGTLNCRYTIKNDGDVRTSPAIGPNGTIYFSGTWNGIVHAVSPNCALNSLGVLELPLIWIYKAGAGILWSSPAMNASADTLYIGDTKGWLHAINAANGVLRWKFKLQGLNRSSSPAIGDDGTIYMGTTAGVSAVKPAANNTKGTLVWFRPTKGYVEATPAIGGDGTIYVGTTTGRTFYAINGVTGAEKWTYKSTPPDSFPTSPLIDKNGIIYTSVGKKVLALNPANGSEKWHYVTGNFINSSPAIGDDGTLYIGSSDHTLYAFGN